jgi:hypothetical protein
MRRNVGTIGVAGVVTMCLVATIVSGCATSRVNLVDTGAVSVEKIPSERIYISRVSVFQEGDELLVSGFVKRRHSSGPGGGHVDIAIVGPDGGAVEKITVSYFPRFIPLTHLPQFEKLSIGMSMS